MRIVAPLLISVLLLLSVPCHGENLLCPPSESSIDTKPSEKWEIKFEGLLSQIWLVRFYSGMEIKTFISCIRFYGAKSLDTAKKCRLIAGNGDLETSYQSTEF